MSTILVVDDRAVCREFLVMLLSYANHRVLEAADGEEALQKAKDEHPDLIITDLLMPTMNGYEMVQKMKTDPQLANIAIIFYTASYLIDEAQLLAQTCDVKYVLYKPSDPILILETVNLALATPGEALTSIPEKLALPDDAQSKFDQLNKIDEQLSKYVSGATVVNNPINLLMEDPRLESVERDRLTQCNKEFVYDLFQIKTISHRLAAMSSLSLNAIAEREPKRLLKMLCDGAHNILESKYCVIGIFNNGDKQLKYFVTSGIDTDTEKQIETPQKNDALFNRIINDPYVFQLNNFNNEIELPANHPNIHYLLGAKLITTTHLYGFIYFVDKHNEDSFTEDDIRIVSALSTEIATLYENADMYNAIQRHAVNLQMKVNEYAGA